MKDNIKPEHYRTGEIDLYEAWYRTYPFEQYRAIMQAIAERYMRRDKNDRVEDLGKAIYTLERLKEKEIEHTEKNSKTIKDAFDDMREAFGVVKIKNAGEYLGGTYLDHETLLKRLIYDDCRYLARDVDGILYAFKGTPKKYDNDGFWETGANDFSLIKNDNIPEVKWTDEEPTKVSELLATYENGGENGK